jgi:hypothetical protein
LSILAFRNSLSLFESESALTGKLKVRGNKDHSITVHQIPEMIDIWKNQNNKAEYFPTAGTYWIY